jgi:hypothetical protein
MCCGFWPRDVLGVVVLVLAGWTGAAHAAIEIVDAHASYPEGPVWQNGKLLYLEYGGPGIKVWDGKSAAAYWRSEHCGASGLMGARTCWLPATTRIRWSNSMTRAS